MTSTSLRPDRLRWIISAALLAPTLAASADPTIATPGPGGTPMISDAHGIPVIDIVAPNGHGVSHNQYLEFNVGEQGAVLNNALQAGESVLAGVLQANAQFQGHAASAIINEVVGFNTTNVLGPQEIFGQKADYILANPNGIVVNGASFINIAQMTFLVGKPEMVDGQIQSLSTLHSQGKVIVGSNGVDHESGAVDLLTPYIEQTGPVSGKGDVTLILGNNRIAHKGGEIRETAAHDPSRPPVDAQLLGAMMGQRIRIVSTTQGAGVRLPEEMLSREGVSVKSAGSINGRGEGVTRVQRSTLEGGSGDVLLNAKDDLTLTAVDISGRNIRGSAGKNLRVDAAIARRLEERREQYKKKAWFIPTEEFSKVRNQEYVEHTGSQWVATGDIALDAGGRIDVSASRLEAGGRLSAKAGDEILIDGRADRSELTETVRHRKHLWRGNSDRHTVVETVAGSSLKAAEIDLQSDTIVHVRGSNVRSEGALRIKAGEKILVDSVELEDSSRHRESRGDALGGVFKNRKSNDTGRQAHSEGSQIVANGSQHLVSDGELTIIGSNATAGGLLEVKAKGPINVLASAEQSEVNHTTQERGFTANASQTKDAQDGKPDSRQYTAGVGYNVTRTAQGIRKTEHRGAALKGGTVNVNSEAALNVTGSSLNSETGKATVTAPHINLLASRDRETVETVNTQAGGSLQVGGGIDRLSSAFEGHTSHEKVTLDTTKAVVSSINAPAGLTLETKKLTNEGTRITTGGELIATFDSAENREATDSVRETRESSQWKGSLGASLEYRDLTRPIEKLVLGEEQARFQQPGVEDALAPPSLGADLDLSYKQRATDQFDSTAQVTRFQGQTIDVQGTELLRDHATQYVATGGTARVQAGQHEQLTVANVSETQLKRLDIEGGVRVDSNTGADLNVRLSGLGSSIDRTTRHETAVVGSLSGATGLQVQLGTDGRYEGSAFNGGTGDVTIKAGGSLDFAQANDRQHLDEVLIDGSAWAKGGSSPAAGKSFGGSGIGQYSQQTGDDSHARTVQFDGQGAMTAKAGQNLRMEGGRIGSKEAKVASIDFSADGRTGLLASVDTHSLSGRKIGGGLQPTVSHSSTGQGGGLGGSITMGKLDEGSRTLAGGDFHSTAATHLGAAARGNDALTIQGLHANAGAIDLNARNGGVLIEAATTTETRDNLSAAGGLGMNASRNQDASTNTHAGFARATLNLDRIASTTHSNTQLRADGILNVDSREDVRLSGANLAAERMTGTIGGDLIVESRQDQVNSLKIDGDARLSSEKNPQGLINGVSAFAGPAAAKVKEHAGRKIQLFDTGITPSLDISVIKQDRNTVGQASGIKAMDSIDLNVGGGTRLSGAAINAVAGKVALGGSSVKLETLSGSDYRAEAIVDLSNAPVDLTQGIIEAAKRKISGETSLDLGLIRAGGHDTVQVLKSSID
ncbi:hemagglutinin repeat-containing protein [Pseudomonas sp. dw_358]|uniref:two-partner secretion domain-containing protein n=1 Tax=Pseudomonas sp. dw_358 TaxID=2720083 RepID=UPI001BD3EFF7|nr:hemagglutinin repeat-containing protein [Pseudomonas sp. dw_358]